IVKEGLDGRNCSLMVNAPSGMDIPAKTGLERSIRVVFLPAISFPFQKRELPAPLVGKSIKSPCVKAIFTG
ncbi:MAG TPA: hypothetical protein VLN44_06445, partial [Pyrinomonadaceae bacterium]|nr:hypothetical protein [Pyrinomonadaceae bacterium]